MEQRNLFAQHLASSLSAKQDSEMFDFLNKMNRCWVEQFIQTFIKNTNKNNWFKTNRFSSRMLIRRLQPFIKISHDTRLQQRQNQS